MNSLNRNTINLKEEHQFSPEILNKDNQTDLCVCGLPQDNPLHGTMNSLNRDWEKKLDKEFPGYTFNSAHDNDPGLYRLKNFIRTILEEAKAEERKRCLEALPWKFASYAGPLTQKQIGWNEAIDQAISAISNKK